MTEPKPSLRSRLARHVLLPLVATWALGTGIVLAVAQHYTAQAFDRSLLDDAHALAAQVVARDGALVLALDARELQALLFDQSESTSYAIRRSDGGLVAGSAALAATPPAPGSDHEFEDRKVDGRPVRVVRLRRDGPQPFVVALAMTTGSRTQLLGRVLLFSAVPQALLLAVLAWWLRRRIAHDLAPLGRLEEAIEHRTAADLSPLPQQVRAGTSTRDVERIAQAVDSLLERLHASVEAQREFAGTVAHELRTPLAGIRAQVAFALAEAPDAMRAHLEGIAQAEQRASRLIDQLLALARAAEADAGLHLEPVDLCEVVRDTLLRFMRRAQAAGVDLGGEGLDGGPVVVLGDRALVEGIVTNLLDNALRYGTGASQPRVTVAVRGSESRVELAVSDNGPGLRAEDAVQWMGRWRQGAAGRRRGEGAGLGLAIVAGYARHLGAKLEYAPPAAGSGLTVRLVWDRLAPGATAPSRLSP